MWESNVLSFFTLLWFLLHNNPTVPQMVSLEISGVFVWFIPDGTRHISFLLRIIFTLEQFNCIEPSKQKKSSAWEWICCNGIFRVFFSGLKGNLKKLHTISFIWIEYISFKKSSPYLNQMNLIKIRKLLLLQEHMLQQHKQLIVKSYHKERFKKTF